MQNLQSMHAYVGLILFKFRMYQPFFDQTFEVPISMCVQQMDII